MQEQNNFVGQNVLDSLERMQEEHKNIEKPTDGSDEEAKNQLLDSIIKLANSDDPEDQRLAAEISKRFQEKMERFNANIQHLSRKQRRKITGYNSFSKRFKSKIGL